MSLLCTSPPDVICANMESAGQRFGRWNRTLANMAQPVVNTARPSCIVRLGRISNPSSSSSFIH